MAEEKIVEISEEFWNIRGVHEMGGLVDIGTQSSLVRLGSGAFVLLDAYTLEGEVGARVMERTRGGQDIEAVLHLHPFHTVHAAALARQLPHARHFGTSRHPEEVPEVDWEDTLVDDPELHARYADDLIFSVPRGVTLVPDHDAVHFSSVLVIHPGSRTLHVDDTLSFVDLPLVGGLAFHPTLRWALEPRAGAADDFRAWARELIALCQDVDHLCTAHGAALPPDADDGRPIAARIEDALSSVEGVLDGHSRRTA
jgi:hypothetical protein